MNSLALTPFTFTVSSQISRAGCLHLPKQISPLSPQNLMQLFWRDPQRGLTWALNRLLSFISSKSLRLSSALEALPLGTKQAPRLLSSRGPSAADLSHLHFPMAFAEVPPLQGCPQGMPLRELLYPRFPSVTPNPNTGCKLQIEASLEFFAILVSNPHTKQKQCDHCANIALKPYRGSHTFPGSLVPFLFR